MKNVTILDISLRRMPFANFAGGQIYEVSLIDGEDNVCFPIKVGGFISVYITSLAFVVLGIIYILVIPESVVKRTGAEEDESKEDEKRSRVNPFVRLWRFLLDKPVCLIIRLLFVFASDSETSAATPTKRIIANGDQYL